MRGEGKKGKSGQQIEAVLFMERLGGRAGGKHDPKRSG